MLGSSINFVYVASLEMVAAGDPKTSIDVLGLSSCSSGRTNETCQLVSASTYTLLKSIHVPKPGHEIFFYLVQPCVGRCSIRLLALLLVWSLLAMICRHKSLGHLGKVIPAVTRHVAKNRIGLRDVGTISHSRSKHPSNFSTPNS